MASIKVEDKGNYQVMSLIGDFVGGEETDSLKEKLMAIGKSDNNQLIIDLSEAVYLSSASLSVFISTDAFFRRYGGKLVLCNANEYVSNIFDITKLHFAVKVAKTIDEAIVKLKEEIAE